MNETFTDYIAFIRALQITSNNTVITITSADIADNDVYLQMSFDIAKELVEDYVRYSSYTFPHLHTLALFNLAMYYLTVISPAPVIALINNATGNNGNTNAPVLPAGSTGLGSDSIGNITSAADQGSSASRELYDYVKSLTPSEASLMQSPWGKAYLLIASKFKGLRNWGVL